MKGDFDARRDLGCMEFEAGNEHRAMQHFILSARDGDSNFLKLRQGL